MRRYLISVALAATLLVGLMGGATAQGASSTQMSVTTVTPWLADFMMGYSPSQPMLNGEHALGVPVRNGAPLTHPRIKSVTVVLTLAAGERLLRSRFSVCCSSPTADKAKAAAQRFKRLPMLNGQRRFSWTVKDIVFGRSATWLIWISRPANGQLCVSATAKPLGGPVQKTSFCAPS